MEGVVTSPVPGDPREVPELSLTDYMFEQLREKLPSLGDKPWVIDVTTGTQVKFCDVESQSRRVASALTRRGFKKGHVLYYVTYEMSHLYVVQIAVWRLGGAVRGSFQGENAVEYARQLRETRPGFVLVDAETAPKLQEAAASLEWPVVLLSVGDVTVPGATSFSQLLEDDGTAFPKEVHINPHEDMVVIPYTSGSTGVPKGAIQTHYNMITAIYPLRNFLTAASSQLTLANSYAAANFFSAIRTFCAGATIHFIGKFHREELFIHLLKYKPSSVTMYPYVATWFSRSPELDLHDLTFLKKITIGGSVLDPTTAALLNSRLPHVTLFQIYAMSECLGIAYSLKTDGNDKTLTTIENQGELCVASGKLLPYVQAKVVDPDSGHVMGRGQRGEILVRAPYVMKGYLSQDQVPNRADIDADGWLHTGDLGFFDDEGNIYVRERKSFLFKYYMHFVSPSEVESVLQEHEAVLAAGVVGVPHPETTSAARALVVLRPDCHATAAELQNYVAQRVPEHMRLHGGVRFVEKLPENRGGKLDRAALKVIATAEESAVVVNH